LSASDALALPGLPKDADGPVFAEPWQAQAFALVVRLHAEGAFSWSEWAAALSEALAGDPDDDGAHYYHHWVEALETLAARCAIVTAEALSARKDAWTDAYHRTPHGSVVELLPAP
jgi:nitrile hydratase accessory protein